MHAGKAAAVMLGAFIVFAGGGCRAGLGMYGPAFSRVYSPAPSASGHLASTLALTPTSSVPGFAAERSEGATAFPRLFTEAGDRLSVLSFNMQHKDRPDQLTVLAEHLKADLAPLPDFILCQEVLFRRARWKGQENTAAVLADRVGYFSKGTKRKSDREGVAIISRYPFAYYAEKHLKARTNPFLLGFRRVSVMGEFLVPGLGRVRVVNVHLAYWTFEHHVRRKQLRETLDWMARREREVPADITILGGDFNIEPRWSEMALITGAGGASGLRFEDYNEPDATRGSPGRPSVRVDHIFVSAPRRDIRMLGERLLYRHGLLTASGSSHFWLSDHLPLYHEYAVGPAAFAASVRSSDRVRPARTGPSVASQRRPPGRPFLLSAHADGRDETEISSIPTE
ncbi:MAG: endonuclease/exonuclease/phosphatase family protein [Planctomycetota bacterium]|jgi:endonuclease/exonuclease/phosphatase family metal-dependent hydrolase